MNGSQLKTQRNMPPITTFKDLVKYSDYGKELEEIMYFYAPLSLLLPSLRSNPELMQVTVKAIGSTGIADVATNADLWMQEQIKQQVVTHPDWQFWGEEGSDNVSEYNSSKKFLITTDPIEGTNNFLAGKDNQWGSVVSLVDIQTKEPVIGIVAHPTDRKFYVGVKGKGAYIIKYGQSEEITAFHLMPMEPEYPKFTYNNSPHFNQKLKEQVNRFMANGKILPLDSQADELKRSRRSVMFTRPDQTKITFTDPESGALEAVRNRGTIYFKTSNEMAAVFVILRELGGTVTDADGNPWSLGINSMVSARTQEDYRCLKSLMDGSRE